MKTQPTYRPFRFFLITFLITWVSWFIAAWFSYQPSMQGLQLLFMVPGLLAPFIAVGVMILGRKNTALRKDFWDRLSPKRIKPRYLPFILLVMPATLFLATSISLLFGRTSSQFLLSSAYDIMDGQVLLSILILFLAPTFEELGWRGYGVDSLRSKFSLFKTTLLFAGLWALWHLPLFFIHGYYQNDLWNMGSLYVINFFISVLPATIMMNWLYYKNERSILAAILFHFMLDLFSVLFQTEQFTKCIITVLLLAISMAIISWDRNFFFAQPEYGGQPVENQ
ncbi:MAG TPA: type II CAAX endopeptidase family protein [Anaerolineales bacterium]|nr:type II CAAX endopeptidase family protein [Anaerolineales bacterium]